MAKPKKKTNKTVNAEVKQKKSFALSERMQDAIFLGIILILLVILLKPMVIDGKSAQGVDVVGSMGKSHQITDYYKTTGERALWNPAIFSGMPIYYRISPVAFSVDNLLQWLGKLSNHVFIYYLFAAFGFFLLMRYLKMSPLLSFIGALIFILMPHYKSLYLEGHFAKFKALMLLPWIFLCFRYFLDRRNLLGAALFAIAFGTQIRTQHYQIVFYTGLLIFAIGVYPFIKDLLEKKFLQFSKSTAMLAGALILAITMAAQPLFLAKEYLPYSKRGKTTIDVRQAAGQEKAKQGDGVSMEYATQWSTHPAELLTWFVPRFYGGMSNEKYSGSKFQQAKGQPVSVYWGHMMFTQSYEYFGAVTLLLALLGLVMFRRDKMILSLIIFSGFLILLSFGRHFQVFYGLFFNYVPFFNKFRAPMMSVAVTYFAFSIFAVYGLRYLSDLKTDSFDLKKHKNLLIILGSFVGLGILLWLNGFSASFVKAAGERYTGQSLEMIKNIRAEYYNTDVIRYIILVLLAAGSIVGYLKKKINFVVISIVLGAMILFDLIQIQGRVHKDYINTKRLEQQYFRKTSTDQFLLADKETFRVFPTGQMFGDNRWGYYHQTIGGYTPIKMFTIEELVEKNIYNGWDKQFPLNWNVLKILNVKYVILQGGVQNEYLELVHSDPANKMFTYEFKERLPRAFFVDNVQVIGDEYQRIETINSREFDPARTAIVEKTLGQDIAAPDSSFSRLTSFSPNRLDFDVYTDKQALLVLSEVYYPPGWKVLIDDQAVQDIYKTDHALQSFVVPAGDHKITVLFEPQSYAKNIKLASVSLGILYLVILVSLILGVMKKRRRVS